MKYLLLTLALMLVVFTANAQRPRGKTTQSSRSRTTQRSTQRNSSATRQNSRSSASSCPNNRHPHLIDLGLPSGTKWACCNVGADKPEAYGGYYAWGEAEEKGEYREDNYHGGSFIDVAIVNSLERREAKQIAENARAWAKAHGKSVPSRNPGDEIVQINWVMPTHAQQAELRDNCTYTWTTMNGVKGGKFTSKKNGRSIFLPAAGGRDQWSKLNHAGSYGVYWSSTLDERYPGCAFDLYFNSEYRITDSPGRTNGCTVRPVSVY